MRSLLDRLRNKEDSTLTEEEIAKEVDTVRAQRYKDAQ
jgi:hypothetical protein